MKRSKPWFEEWFNSPYYHILYGQRDYNEAKRFIENLLAYLQPVKESTFLDLACGKGRHALEIANHGYPTTGIDLSVNSIDEARKLNNPLLRFEVGDMRNVHFPNAFSYIFNLFTSFGYFDDHDGQKQSLDAMHAQLKAGGTLVIDYLNTYKVEQLIEENPIHTLSISDIEFHIKKRLSSQFISKEISFHDKGTDYHFYEHVWRLSLENFQDLLENSGFEIQTIFGDYELNNFKPNTSDRLIMVAKRT
ncbi:MAG: class I SAM-dependent methyltransferase [Bacteroidia bacterium]|nr:class I SAM-dependent methyltransferase [Bacteroidia bacterium]